MLLCLRDWLHGDISLSPCWDFSPATEVWKRGEWFEQETQSVEISQVVTNMQHKTNIFRCVFQINHIYYFFIALHKALSVFHTSCFLFKTFPPSFPSPSSPGWNFPMYSAPNFTRASFLWQISCQLNLLVYTWSTMFPWQIFLDKFYLPVWTIQQ